MVASTTAELLDDDELIVPLDVPDDALAAPDELLPVLEPVVAEEL